MGKRKVSQIKSSLSLAPTLDLDATTITGSPMKYSARGTLKESSGIQSEPIFFYQQSRYADPTKRTNGPLSHRPIRIPFDGLPKVVRNSYQTLSRGLGPGGNFSSTRESVISITNTISEMSRQSGESIQEEPPTEMVAAVISEDEQQRQSAIAINLQSPVTQNALSTPKESPNRLQMRTDSSQSAKLYTAEGDIQRMLFHQFRTSSRDWLKELSQLLYASWWPPSQCQFTTSMDENATAKRIRKIPRFLEYRLQTKWRDLITDALYETREWQTTAAWKERVKVKPVLPPPSQSSKAPTVTTESSDDTKSAGRRRSTLTDKGGGHLVGFTSARKDSVSSTSNKSTKDDTNSVTGRKLGSLQSRSLSSHTNPDKQRMRASAMKSASMIRLSTLGEENMSENPSEPGASRLEHQKNYVISTLQFVLSSKEAANKGWITSEGSQPLQPLLEWMILRLHHAIHQKEESTQFEEGRGIIVPPIVLLHGDSLPPKSASRLKQRQYIARTPSLAALYASALSSSSLSNNFNSADRELDDNLQNEDLPPVPIPQLPLYFPWERRDSNSNTTSVNNIWQCRAYDGTTCVFYPNGQLAIMASYGTRLDDIPMKANKNIASLTSLSSSSHNLPPLLMTPYILVFPLLSSQGEQLSMDKFERKSTGKRSNQWQLPLPQAIFTSRGDGVLYHNASSQSLCQDSVAVPGNGGNDTGDNKMIPHVVLTEKYVLQMAEMTGALVKKQMWGSLPTPSPGMSVSLSPKLSHPIFVHINEHISFRCESRHEISIKYHFGNCKVVFPIGGDIFSSDSGDYLPDLVSDLPFKSHTAREILKNKKGRGKQTVKKLTRTVDKHRQHMMELQQNMDIDNKKFESEDEKYLAKMRNRVANLCESWLEHYRIHLGIHVHPLSGVPRAERTAKSALPKEKGNSDELVRVATDRRPITAMGTSLRDDEAEDATGTSPINGNNEHLSHRNPPLSDRRDVSFSPTVAIQPAGVDLMSTQRRLACPAYVRAKLLKLADGGAMTLCHCSRVQPPYLTDLEFDHFLQKAVPPQQLICIAIIKSSPLENVNFFSRMGNMDENVGVNTHSSDPQLTPHSFNMAQEGMTMARFLQGEYAIANRSRAQQPCLISNHDNYRVFFYDISTAANLIPCTQSLLLRRHAVVPGLCFIYQGGRLLFAEPIFNGYGISRKDFHQQLRKCKDMADKGFALPLDYRLSTDRHNRDWLAASNVQSMNTVFGEKKTPAVMIRTSTTSFIPSKGNMSHLSLRREKTHHAFTLSDQEKLSQIASLQLPPITTT